ncbi:hypothetical protein HY486_01930 [Candidatus Woesearchaeota archaeon]|nr:hypothetical protein [Candidatus Woesearchaeota archaeon]
MKDNRLFVLTLVAIVAIATIALESNFVTRTGLAYEDVRPTAVANTLNSKAKFYQPNVQRQTTEQDLGQVPDIDFEEQLSEYSGEDYGARFYETPVTREKTIEPYKKVYSGDVQIPKQRD